MTNHVHLLLTPAKPTACGHMMRDLGRCYVRYFNRKYERTGTLWEGRFRSSLAQSARYVIALYRYIEENPVRAGMVPAPGHYAWSSYLVNAGTRTDPLIKPHCEFLALANGARAHAAYQALFQQPLEDAMLRQIREATDGGYPLASESYKAAVLGPLGARVKRGKPGPRGPASE
jgi:putative transposase